MDGIIHMTEASPVVVAFGRAAAADVRRLAGLHDHEPTTDLLEELRAQPLQDLFGLTLDRPDIAQALALLGEALDTLPRPADAAALDELAADFAAIHLTNALRACPIESVWVHEEPLRRQEAMFRVKAWHRRFGVVTDDPRDPDHLVLELHFLAELLERGLGAEAADFLDQHPLRWVPAFCGRVAARCRTPYFAGTALLTGGYLDALRDLLAQGFDRPRPARQDAESRRKEACG
ncbi:TorD/DmsD family molecular chaperone [Azospirillum rugosum]|uniref:TorA maturation chaperone TorD n=1 Tax=Azospirillum rugosum TaxID=416170 RepID=A0ABS4STM3_9PROT|nr:molecular chaperone TorD family protein [Azospirillum rugosum]MBP2295312.1 TorA maturation chaperone TorD [Azospirillum rugosum]MDQ0528687.1 TorA maturation chaperone TorD [Azospirillum rugosum]